MSLTEAVPEAQNSGGREESPAKHTYSHASSVFSAPRVPSYMGSTLHRGELLGKPNWQKAG